MTHIKLGEIKWIRIVLLERILDLAIFGNEMITTIDKKQLPLIVSPEIELNGVCYSIETTLFENVMKDFQLEKIVEILQMKSYREIEAAADKEKYVFLESRKNKDATLESIKNKISAHCFFIVLDIEKIKREIGRLNSIGISTEILKNNFLEKVGRVERNNTKEDKNKLNFYSETGDITYKNEKGEVKSGTKGFAFLSFLSESKNTPFTLDDIKEYCNPRVNKTSHYFKGEKDVDDSIRLLKSKLNVNNNSFFPIEKKGAKNKKMWIWIEK